MGIPKWSLFSVDKTAVFSFFQDNIIFTLRSYLELNKMAYTAKDPRPPHDVFCFNS